MLEIIAIVFLVTRMGRILRRKGWKPAWMQAFVVIGWLGAMFISACGYGVWLALTRGPEEVNEVGFLVYPIMLLSAAVTQGLLFLIAHRLRDRTKEPPVGVGAGVSIP